MNTNETKKATEYAQFGLFKCFDLVSCKWEREGEIGRPPKPKECCGKMVLFPNALFLVTNFRKK